jgi:hypothetical protein
LTAPAPLVSATQETSPDALRLEALALGKLILRRDIDPQFIDRYIEAHNHVFTGPQPLRDLAIVHFAASHAWLLPALDAAAAFKFPNSLLHKKALLMAAILEASPCYADDFLPRRCGWPSLVILTARLGIGTACALIIGLPLLFFLRSRQ